MYLVSILQILEILSIFIQNCCPSSLFNTQKQRSRPQRWFCCGCLSCSSCLSTSPLISQCLFRVGISALVMIQSLLKESRAEQLFSLILPIFSQICTGQVITHVWISWLFLCIWRMCVAWTNQVTIGKTLKISLMFYKFETPSLQLRLRSKFEMSSLPFTATKYCQQQLWNE